MQLKTEHLPNKAPSPQEIGATQQLRT